MRVLLTGASGFIGSHLRRGLAAAGHAVRCAGRRPPADHPDGDFVAADFTRDHLAADWLPHLAGVDAVVNAAGILREQGQQTFEAVHVAAPAALFAACAAAGVRRVVQVSALGADAGAASGYHRSKRSADDALLALPVSCAVAQPSLVFGADGASARLFCGLATLPMIPLPGYGQQRVQPIHVDDLVLGLLALLEPGRCEHRRVPLVGPAPLTLAELLAELRRGLGLGRARFVAVPLPLVRGAARLAARRPGALLDAETLAMLERGNTADPAATRELLGREPRAVRTFVAPARAASLRAQAQLPWLLGGLRVALGLMWLITGIVSLGLYPVAESYALLARTGITGTLAPVALYGAAALDLALGLGVLLLRRRAWLWRAQLALMLAYTAIISVALPEFWLHPYGPVLKNLPLLAATWLVLELERR